jgi:hypothetical protein
MCMVRLKAPAALLSVALVLAGTFALRAQGLPVPYATPPPAPAQPLPYSHRQHIELGLDCRDCHVQPDGGPKMTFPGTDTCMSCHATMPGSAATLKTLSAFSSTGRPIPWARIYEVPTFVYWSHASHLSSGLTCANCHGAVERSDTMRRDTNVATKVGCVTCHETRQILSDCGDCHEPRQ